MVAYPPEELLDFQSSIPQAASWLIAEKLVRECDDVFLTWSDTPEGGGYDTVHVNIRPRGRNLELLLNREGSLHIAGDVRGGNIARPGVWLVALTHQGRRRVIQDIYATLDMQPKPDNSSTPTSIMCRVLGQALVQSFGSSGIWTTYTELPNDPSLLEQVSSQREFSELLTWVLAKDDEPVARFKDGWMWVSSGSRFDLYSEYRSGSSVQELAARVHGKARKPRDVPLTVRGFDESS